MFSPDLIEKIQKNIFLSLIILVFLCAGLTFSFYQASKMVTVRNVKIYIIEKQ